MYEPAHFRVEEKKQLVAFLRAHPLGLLIVQGAENITADLIPFLVDDEGLSLRAHFARANPLLQALATGQSVLVVFCGPQAYISPGYYPSKAEHGRVVPTWNYAMVQAQGLARLREEPEWISTQIADLTAQQEASRPAPWSPEDAPRDFIAAQLRAIVGLEIAIDDLRGKYKLSQNRSQTDRRGVLAGLAEEKSPEPNSLAELMLATQPTKGPEAP
ncbi:FMN-binding negative transcriptional regulator [Rhodoblastus sp.]